MPDEPTPKSRAEMLQQIADLEATEARMDAHFRERRHDDMLKLERRMCEKFRVLREERGWSQAELAEKVGEWGFSMHQTTIAKIESGSRPLRVAEMYALSHVFRMPPAAVFFMARSTRERDSMQQLSDAIEDIETRMRTFQDMTVESVENAIIELAHMQSQRNQLVDAMRDAARDPADPQYMAGLDGDEMAALDREALPLLTEPENAQKGARHGEHHEAP